MKKKTIYWILLVLSALCFISYFLTYTFNETQVIWHVFEIAGFVFLFSAIIIARTDKTNTLRITDKAKAVEAGNTVIEIPKKGSYTLFKLSILLGIPALVFLAIQIQGKNNHSLLNDISATIMVRVLLPVFSIALLSAWANILMSMRIIKGGTDPGVAEPQSMKRTYIKIFLFWLSVLAGLSGIGLLFWCPSPSGLILRFFLPLLVSSLVFAWADIIYLRKRNHKQECK